MGNALIVSWLGIIFWCFSSPVYAVSTDSATRVTATALAVHSDALGIKKALLQSAVVALEDLKGEALQKKLQLIEETSRKVDSIDTVKDWYELLDSYPGKELGLAFGAAPIGQRLRIPIPPNQMPETQQTLVRTITGFDDAKLWRRFLALYENPRTKTALVQISNKALGVAVSNLKNDVERGLPQDVLGLNSPLKEIITVALSDGKVPTLQAIDKFAVEMNKKLVSQIKDQQDKLQAKLKVDQALPEIYRVVSVADTTFTSLKSFVDSPYSVDRAAAAVNALAALSGDANISKAAYEIERVSTAVSQGNQIISMFASASTGVGALAVVGALANTYGAFSAVGGPNQATGDHQVLEALSSLTKEINKQFGIVNGKLDKVLDHLEAINAQLFGIVGRLQIIDGRLDEINQNLASLDKKLELMDRRLVTIQQTLDRLEAGPRKRCLGWIKARATSVTDKDVSTCLTTFFQQATTTAVDSTYAADPIADVSNILAAKGPLRGTISSNVSVLNRAILAVTKEAEVGGLKDNIKPEEFSEGAWGYMLTLLTFPKQAGLLNPQLVRDHTARMIALGEAYQRAVLSAAGVSANEQRLRLSKLITNYEEVWGRLKTALTQLQDRVLQERINAAINNPASSVRREILNCDTGEKIADYPDGNRLTTLIPAALRAQVGKVRFDQGRKVELLEPTVAFCARRAGYYSLSWGHTYFPGFMGRFDGIMVLTWLGDEVSESPFTFQLWNTSPPYPPDWAILKDPQFFGHFGAFFDNSLRAGATKAESKARQQIQARLLRESEPYNALENAKGISAHILNESTTVTFPNATVKITDLLTELDKSLDLLRAYLSSLMPESLVTDDQLASLLNGSDGVRAPDGRLVKTLGSCIQDIHKSVSAETQTFENMAESTGACSVDLLTRMRLATPADKKQPKVALNPWIMLESSMDRLKFTVGRLPVDKFQVGTIPVIQNVTSMLKSFLVRIPTQAGR